MTQIAQLTGTDDDARRRRRTCDERDERNDAVAKVAATRLADAEEGRGGVRTLRRSVELRT